MRKLILPTLAGAASTVLPLCLFALSIAFFPATDPNDDGAERGAGMLLFIIVPILFGVFSVYFFCVITILQRYFRLTLPKMCLAAVTFSGIILFPFLYDFLNREMELKERVVLFFISSVLLVLGSLVAFRVYIKREWYWETLTEKPSFKSD